LSHVNRSVLHHIALPSGALAFIDYELRNNFDKIGRALETAKTIAEACNAAAPYWSRITGVRAIEEANATGYADPELSSHGS
jgi:hypothetical protein